VACFGSYETLWLGTISLNPQPPVVAALSLSGPECRIAILRSEYTSKFFKTAANYDAHVEYWRKLVLTINMTVDLVTDSQLEEGLQGFQILLVPSAICLSEKEKASIRDFVSKGGSAICTWATGARDETGAWKGLDFLSELTGADTFEFTPRTSPWFLTFASGNPLTAGAPEGSRVQVDSPERLEAKSPGVDGYWSDARLFPVDPNLPVNFQGALLHNAYGRGRVAWYGFQENSAVAGGNDKAILDLTLFNTLAWAGRKTLCAVNSWPALYSSASVFACDVEDKFDNAGYAANALRKAQEKGTFFCVADMVKENPDLIPQLEGAGEVAVHGDTHDPFSPAGVLSQIIRMEKARWRLWRLGGSWASGFHPPFDAFGNHTLEALAATHFHYVMLGAEGSAGEANSVLPDILRVSQSSRWFHRNLDLVRLTRTMDDDLHYSPLGIVGLNPSWIAQRALADFEIIHGLGGLYIFAFHSQGFSAPEYVGIIPVLIEQFHRSKTWIATAEEVADWWQSRSHVLVSVSEKGTNVIRLTVKYGGAKPLDNAALTVYPSGDSAPAHVTPVGAPTATAEIIPDTDNGHLSLRLGRLDPGMTYQFDLSWRQ
jgi:peptidoglycan/xylan/chitin deacetylase (PgdA/CDA1 family)